MNSTKFKGHTIVVTGAAQGIGRQYAEVLAQNGAHVALCDVNADGVRAAAEALVHQGYSASAHRVDVTSMEDAKDLAAQLAEADRQVVGLVNNAALFSALGSLKPFWEISAEEWDRVMAVNVRGVWAMTTALLPLMEQSGGGSVVNISSAAVWRPRAGYLHYVASKGAVYGMTNALARELGEKDIRVNAIAPGMVLTEVPRDNFSEEQRERTLSQQALKQLGEPSSVADVVVFLLGDESQWMTGQTLHVDGGLFHR
jgi:NAD(P)-dependent dehydrogenase (short-subunit alcohol dehydrogenase family)